MILGFGITETKTARAIIQECLAAIRDNQGKPASESIEPIRNRHEQAYDENGKLDKANAPERYSCFWCSCSGGFVRFDFHHINRRHVLSPDGWGMLQTSWVLDVEEGKIFQEK